MRIQWKTISKAFKDMNKDIHTDGISKDELRFYLNHWGLQMTDERFLEIYAMFDNDKDGNISYSDFHQSIGNEIHPGETLYFRQEKLKVEGAPRTNCFDPSCCQDAIGGSLFCNLHDLIKKDEVQKTYRRIMNSVGEKNWNEFKYEIKKNANPDDDYKEIEFKKFQEILKNVLNIKLSPDEKELFSQVCGKSVYQTVYINISQIAQIKFNQQLKKIYDDLKLAEFVADEAKDAAGFTGDFRRKTLVLKDMTHRQFIAFFVLYPKKLAELMQTIRKIDDDRNGYVT